MSCHAPPDFHSGRIDLLGELLTLALGHADPAKPVGTVYGERLRVLGRTRTSSQVGWVGRAKILNRGGA